MRVESVAAVGRAIPLLPRLSELRHCPVHPKVGLRAVLTKMQLEPGKTEGNARSIWDPPRVLPNQNHYFDYQKTLLSADEVVKDGYSRCKDWDYRDEHEQTRV